MSASLSDKCPKVSVVVPNYNHARYLSRRLDSILNQTFTDFEVIILDDASTDESRDVIAPYLKDHRVVFHPNTKNSGSPFIQWNRGVEMARGEYVWLAESDDLAKPLFLETLVRILDRNPAVGIAYCQSSCIGPNDESLGTLEFWTEDLDPVRWKSDYVNDGRGECEKYLVFKNTVPNASAVLFRKAIYQMGGGAPENMRLCGDWLTWVRMLLRANIAYTSKVLNEYRRHPQSVRETTNKVRFMEETWTVQLHVVRKCKIALKQRRRLVRQNLDELLYRIQASPPSERLRFTLRSLYSFKPFLLVAPSTVARWLMQRIGSAVAG